jgi:hypothetical protein
MSDNGTKAVGLTLEALASEIADLRAKSDAQEAKSIAQEAEIVRLRGKAPQLVTADRPPSTSQVSASVTPIESGGSSDLGDHPVSRRGALRALGGVAAGGVGLALGSTLLGAEPAAAANGDNLVLGEANTATSATTLSGDAGVENTFLTVQTVNSTAVYGETQNGFGVYGFSDNTVGVFGKGGNDGYGLVGLGGMAPLLLRPSAAPGPPTTGTHQPGELFVDFTGALFSCYATNKWVRINKGFTNLLPTPIRVFDSRITGAANVADPSRAAGPFAASAIVTLQITGATVGGHSVPAGASAVIGNVTAVAPTAGGWLTLFPHGEATPLVSNLNFQTGDEARGNFCVVALDATGKMDVFAQSSTQVIFDVTGYVF